RSRRRRVLAVAHSGRFGPCAPVPPAPASNSRRLGSVACLTMITLFQMTDPQPAEAVRLRVDWKDVLVPGTDRAWVRRLGTVGAPRPGPRSWLAEKALDLLVAALVEGAEFSQQGLSLAFFTGS